MNALVGLPPAGFTAKKSLQCEDLSAISNSFRTFSLSAPSPSHHHYGCAENCHMLEAAKKMLAHRTVLKSKEMQQEEDWLSCVKMAVAVMLRIPGMESSVIKHMLEFVICECDLCQPVTLHRAELTMRTRCCNKMCCRECLKNHCSKCCSKEFFCKRCGKDACPHCTDHCTGCCQDNAKMCCYYCNSLLCISCTTSVQNGFHMIALCPDCDNTMGRQLRL
mmetsp:Transcript_21689/g.42612  ORF Transcript_21689/g.42612 Transcript_21689/m.42612 type:complete len:220 (-) Transcript_21689:231-890(-)